MELSKNQKGQATVEYLFILVFIALLASQIITNLGNFFGKSLGNFAHVLTGELTVGVCKTNCFFESYVNGAKEE